MNTYQFFSLIIFVVFWGIYFRKNSNQTKIYIFALAAGDLISIIVGHSVLRYSCKTLGFILAIIGIVIYFSSIITRNSSTLSIDLVSIGILLVFFNWFLLALTVVVIILLHFGILAEEKYEPEIFGDNKKKVSRYFGRKTAKFWIPLILVCVIAVVGYCFYGISNMNKLPEMSFEDCLKYSTKNNSDAVISVGIIKDGQVSYKVYGENGRELANDLHTYEIGSLTKTMTAACIYNAEKEGLINIEDTIDNYLDLPKGNAYPTVKELLTHTSGYKGFYFAWPLIINGVMDSNSFYGINRDMVIKSASEISLPDQYGFNYSNFGFALLGMILENTYKEDYQTIINNFVKEYYGFENTSFTQDKGDLGNYWDWKNDDAYASAGAVTSNIEEMLKYANAQLTDERLSDSHEKFVEFSQLPKAYAALSNYNIYINAVAYGWMIDDVNGIIWHNGGTDDYNSYLAFCPERGTAVVVLSNLPDDYRIPATILGRKLLDEIN